MDLAKIREKVEREIDIMMAEVTYWMPTEESKQEKLSLLTAHKQRILSVVEEIFKSDVRVDFIRMLREALDNPSSIRKLADQVIGENREHQSPVVGSSRPEESVRPPNRNQNPFYDPKDMFDVSRRSLPPRQESAAVNHREPDSSPARMINGYSNPGPPRQEMIDTRGPMMNPPARNMHDSQIEPRDVVVIRRGLSPTDQNMYGSQSEPGAKRQNMVDNRREPSPSLLNAYREPGRQNVAASYPEPLPNGRSDPYETYNRPGPSSLGAFGSQGPPGPINQDPARVPRYPDGRPEPYDIYSAPYSRSQGALGTQEQSGLGRRDPSDAPRHPIGRHEMIDNNNVPGPSSHGAIGQLAPYRQGPSSAPGFAGLGGPTATHTSSGPDRSDLLPLTDEKMDWGYQGEHMGVKLAKAITQTDPRSRPSQYCYPPPPLPSGRVDPPSPTHSASSTNSGMDPDSGKCYTSILNEYCTKKKWNLSYELAEGSPPGPNSQFLMKVVVVTSTGERMEFVAPFPSPKKKVSIAMACKTCLEYLASLEPPPFNDIRFFLRAKLT